jgi:mono/diheme cytochrome c family protein
LGSEKFLREAWDTNLIVSAPGGTGLDTTQHDYRKTSIERFMNVGVSVKILALVLTSVLLAGCSKESKDSSNSGKDADAERGRAVYLANCVACHNNDPSKDGAIGPALKGSSKELIESRVLSTSYPPNYKPKRPTKVMPQFPFLKDEIPYLAAYLR